MRILMLACITLSATGLTVLGQTKSPSAAAQGTKSAQALKNALNAG